MAEILVGTASWTDKTLIQCKRFYPPSARSAEARLRYYASHFRLVEVDSTYYALPSAATAELWRERTPDDFVFNVKAFRLFTGHSARARALPVELRRALDVTDDVNLYYRDLPPEINAELWRRFRAALEPLRRAGKLGAVLLQFAPWIIADREGAAHVLHCREMLEGFAVAAEFRNRSWFSARSKERVLALERAHGLVNVVVDEPQGFTSSVPAVWEVTVPELGVVRLHGRNRDTWTQKGLESSAERFNYLYSTRELEELAVPVRELSARVQRLHVLFNNCHEDKAQRNAIEFSALLAR